MDLALCQRATSIVFSLRGKRIEPGKSFFAAIVSYNQGYLQGMAQKVKRVAMMIQSSTFFCVCPVHINDKQSFDCTVMAAILTFWTIPWGSPACTPDYFQIHYENQPISSSLLLMSPSGFLFFLGVLRKKAGEPHAFAFPKTHLFRKSGPGHSCCFIALKIQSALPSWGGVGRLGKESLMWIQDWDGRFFIFALGWTGQWPEAWLITSWSRQVYVELFKELIYFWICRLRIPFFFLDPPAWHSHFLYIWQ